MTKCQRESHVIVHPVILHLIFLSISLCRYNRLKFLNMQITIDLKITFTFPSSRNGTTYCMVHLNSRLIQNQASPMNI